MLGFGHIFGRGASPAPDPDAGSIIPAELVEAIGLAQVSTRGEPDPEDGSVRTLVRITGIGHFAFDGIEETAARIARQYPSLTRQACTRAARLIADRVAADNRLAFKGQRQRRGWVWAW
jgi:hypothetical protein